MPSRKWQVALNPNSIDSVAIVAMFSSIHQSVHGLKCELSALKASLESRMMQIEDFQNEEEDQVIELSGRCEKTDEKSVLMAELIIKQEQKIAHLENRITDLEKRSMKKNIIVTGIKKSKDENCDMESKDFLRCTLRVDQEIRW